MITIDPSNIVTIVIALVLALNGWILFGIRNTRELIQKIADKQDASLITNTAYGVKVENLGTNLLEVRTDLRLLTSENVTLKLAVAEVKLVTQKAVERADMAYKEANTVNQKIESLGLQVVGGRKLNDSMV